MGILSNTVNICHFRVAGEIPDNDLFQWASERLAKNGFRPIDDGADELSAGWVEVDDQRERAFDSPATFYRDHYLVFSLRRDQRRIPAAILKSSLQEA
ncbi:MAG: exonuclease, partial [Deltaproteobacteria bacterium]